MPPRATRELTNPVWRLHIRKLALPPLHVAQAVPLDCCRLACLPAPPTADRAAPTQSFPPLCCPQKCATTSLFHNLKDHPSIAIPVEKASGPGQARAEGLNACKPAC